MSAAVSLMDYDCWAQILLSTNNSVLSTYRA